MIAVSLRNPRQPDRPPAVSGRADYQQTVLAALQRLLNHNMELDGLCLECQILTQDLGQGAERNEVVPIVESMPGILGSRWRVL